MLTGPYNPVRMPTPRTPGQATAALLVGLALVLLGLGLLLFAGLPVVGLQPAHPGRFAQAQPLLLAAALASLLAGAWLGRSGWAAVRRTSAPPPSYLGWRNGLRFGAAFGLTWLFVSV